MTIPQNKDYYSTTDIALAAYLHSQGFDLISVDDSKFPTTFSFNNSSEDFQKYIGLWERTKAEGNLVQFYRSYKTMISKIKDNNSKEKRKR
jgi:hypothetical protein